MWHLTAWKISVSLSILNWIKKEMIFYHISEIMLATLIPRYLKKIISFQEQETNWKFTGSQKLCKNIVSDTSRSINFGYLLAMPQWGNSNKYTKTYVLWGNTNKTSSFLHIIQICLRILCKSQFILMATSLGTNPFVVAQVHCTHFQLW